MCRRTPHVSANPCVRRDPASPPTRVQGLKGPDLRVCGPGSADCSLLSLFCVCSGRRDHLPAADLPAGRAADCTALPRGRPGWCRIASPERAADSLLHGRGPHWAVFHPDCFGGCAGGVWCPAVSFPCLCRIPFTRAVGGSTGSPGLRMRPRTPPTPLPVWPSDLCLLSPPLPHTCPHLCSVHPAIPHMRCLEISSCRVMGSVFRGLTLPSPSFLLL